MQFLEEDISLFRLPGKILLSGHGYFTNRRNGIGNTSDTIHPRDSLSSLIHSTSASSVSLPALPSTSNPISS